MSKNIQPIRFYTNELLEKGININPIIMTLVFISWGVSFGLILAYLF